MKYNLTSAQVGELTGLRRESVSAMTKNMPPELYTKIHLRMKLYDVSSVAWILNRPVKKSGRPRKQ